MSTKAANHRRLLRRLAEAALRERGLLGSIPERVEDEAAQLDGPAAAVDEGIEDLRELSWCSIDNSDSKDLDQLTHAERGPDGAIRIRIAVADVDALVPTRSIIDRHAQVNTTSIYVPGTVFPMLPLRLSTDLTSLNPHEDRRAIVTEMTVAPDGTVHDESIRRAVVHNHAQLAYPDVAAWLERPDAVALPAAARRVTGLDEILRIKDEAASRLRERRQDAGALDLQTIQAEAVFEGDTIVDLVDRRQDRAQELIEDFMIAVNGVTARFLESSGFPTFRRVVRTPDRWGRICEVAARHGGELPRQPDSRALDRFLLKQHRADPLRFPDLSLVIIKLIGSGEYVVEPPGRGTLGHFGLAVRDYVHSTAPNRRYPDLIAQRLVKAALDGSRSPYELDDLDELAQHCTVQEDEASKAERQVRKSAAALLLEPSVGAEFAALVTGTTQSGTWIRTLDPPTEGMLVRGGSGLEVGDRLVARLASVNVERGFLDFERAG